jgi:chemotaxis family two-component system sensor kinase Cph1
LQELEERAKALAQRTDELARSNRELEQFAHVASHDLQEPLRAVSGFCQLLKKRYEGKLDPEANEFIAHAVDGADRMRTLINDLLAYSGIRTHGNDLALVDSSEAFDRAVANLRAAIQENDAKITQSNLPVLRADQPQLVQLLQNLIGNAIKFRGEQPPRVHVEATQRGSEWLFSVRDNGIGIEPQYSERVFSIFQRLHTRTKYPGTGIGLAICKKIVERHGGHIWIDPTVASGSLFLFTIPIKDSEQQ